jgi:PST family polysaccharide transporter
MTFSIAARLYKLLIGPVGVIYMSIMAKAGLAFVINALVARWFGPSEFGLYFFFVFFVMIGHSLLGEGLDAGMVRYYAYYHKNDKAQVPGVLGSALAVRIVGMLLFVLAMAIASEWLALQVFDDPRVQSIAVIGAVAACGTALLNLGLSLFQAKQQFLLRAIFTPAINILRLVLVTAFWWAGVLTLESVLWQQVFAAVVVILIVAWVIRSDLATSRVTRRHIDEQLRFNVWGALATASILVYSNLGVPVLKHQLGDEAAGYFAAAATLLLVIEYVTYSVMMVVLPSLSEHTDRRVYVEKVRRWLPLCLAVAVLVSPALLLVEPLIILVYGETYQPSVSVAQILFVSVLINIVSYPVSIVLMAMNRPGVFAFCHVVPIATWVFADSLFIGRDGIDGAAIATLTARITAAMLILASLWSLLRRSAGATQQSGTANQ